MGWFGFGGSRSREERTRVHARSNSDGANSDWANDDRAGTRFVHEAIRIDRAGKPSRLLDDRPRRLYREERRGRR